MIAEPMLLSKPPTPWEQMTGAFRDGLDQLERRAESRQIASSLTYRDYLADVAPWLPGYYHIGLVVETLERVAAGEILRLQIHAPPRYFKSFLVSRGFSSYFLRRFPARWVGLGCATAPLARGLSKDARELYRLSGGVLRQDTKAADDWRTDSGGGMWARGVASGILGGGYDLGIVDDPFRSRLEAIKAIVQQRVEDWFWEDFWHRKQKFRLDPALPEPAVIIMHQRLAEGDLSDRVYRAEEESPEGWWVLNLPAIKREKVYAFPSTCRVIDDGRKLGEVLCEDLDSREALEKEERRNGYLFDTLFQQLTIRTEGGGVFEESWFGTFGYPGDFEDFPRDAPIGEIVRYLERLRVIAPIYRQVRSWDLGVSGRGDMTVGARGGIDTEGWVSWLDVVEMQANEAEIPGLILETAQEDGHEVEVVLPDEPAIGKMAIGAIERMLQRHGFTVIVAPQKGSKRMRALGHAGRARPASGETAGKVRFLHGPWNNRSARQHHEFDGLEGKPDDIVDAKAIGFAVLDGGQPGEVMRPHMRTRRAGARRRGYRSAA